jgi:hypothetical protein
MKRNFYQLAGAMTLAVGLTVGGCSSDRPTSSVPPDADSSQRSTPVHSNGNANASEYHSFTLADFLPQECFERNSEIRVIVRQRESGEMEVENELPTHRYAMEIFGGMIVALEEGKAPMSGFPKDTTSEGPNMSFQAGMLRLDWFNGAEHQLEGTIQMNGHTFVSDPNYPLIFKVVKGEGYVCLCGRGNVVSPSGETVQLGADDTVDMWITRTKSPVVLTREAAAQALGRLAKQRHSERQQSVEALAHLLKDTSFEVRRNAIESLVGLQAVSKLSAIEAVAGREPGDPWMEAIKEWARTELSGVAPM